MPPYPEVKGVTPKEIWQKFRSENVWEDLEFDPQHVPWLFINNLVQRVLARTVGMGPYGPVTIKCNKEGALYVAGIGGGYSRNEVKSGNAANAYAGAAIAFSAVMGRVDLFIFDNPVYVKRSRDGVVWDDEIELFQDAFYSFDCNTLELNIKNKTADATARYQFVGWYGES